MFTTANSTRYCWASRARAKLTHAAKVIEAANRPALVMAHNKTLAAQLYHEFKSFFPHNAVEYFVSYYDFYQPEAYVPAADLYIEKESTINDELDKLRLSATRSLFERRDVLIVVFGQLHLWPGVSGGLLRHDAVPRKGAEDQARTTSPANWSKFFTSAPKANSGEAHFECVATSLKFIPPTTTWRTASRCSEMRSSRSAQIDPLFGTVKQTLHAAANLSEDALRDEGGDASLGRRIPSRRTGLVGG